MCLYKKFAQANIEKLEEEMAKGEAHGISVLGELIESFQDDSYCRKCLHSFSLFPKGKEDDLCNECEKKLFSDDITPVKTGNSPMREIKKKIKNGYFPQLSTQMKLRNNNLNNRDLDKTTTNWEKYNNEML
jgi:hypothetical protein